MNPHCRLGLGVDRRPWRPGRTSGCRPCAGPGPSGSRWSAIPWTPTSTGSLPRSTRPCQARPGGGPGLGQRLLVLLGPEAPAEGELDGVLDGREGGRELLLGGGERQWRTWAISLVKGTAPAPGTVRGWTVPEGTNGLGPAGCPRAGDRPGHDQTGEFGQVTSTTGCADRDGVADLGADARDGDASGPSPQVAMRGDRRLRTSPLDRHPTPTGVGCRPRRRRAAESEFVLTVFDAIVRRYLARPSGHRVLPGGPSTDLQARTAGTVSAGLPRPSCRHPRRSCRCATRVYGEVTWGPRTAVRDAMPSSASSGSSRDSRCPGAEHPRSTSTERAAAHSTARNDGHLALPEGRESGQIGSSRVRARLDLLPQVEVWRGIAGLERVQSANRAGEDFPRDRGPTRTGTRPCGQVPRDHPIPRLAASVGYKPMKDCHLRHAGKSGGRPDLIRRDPT